MGKVLEERWGRGGVSGGCWRFLGLGGGVGVGRVEVGIPIGDRMGSEGAGEGVGRVCVINRRAQPSITNSASVRLPILKHDFRNDSLP